MRAPAAEAAKITPELLLQLRKPTELALSPDGSQVAYIVTPVFREKGKGLESRLWIDDAPATKPGATDVLPRYAQDGRLAYASAPGHHARLSVVVHDPGGQGEVPG